MNRHAWATSASPKTFTKTVLAAPTHYFRCGSSEQVVGRSAAPPLAKAAHHDPRQGERTEGDE
jgi:hypothetical protein